MSRRRKPPSSDPRRLGGSIVGPGGPEDRHGVIIDTRDAVLLERVYVAAMEPYRDGQPGQPIIALQMGGRINKTVDQAEVLFLVDEDGAASVVSELIGVASRMGPEFLDRLMSRLDQVPRG